MADSGAAIIIIGFLLFFFSLYKAIKKDKIRIKDEEEEIKKTQKNLFKTEKKEKKLALEEEKITREVESYIRDFVEHEKEIATKELEEYNWLKEENYNPQYILDLKEKVRDVLVKRESQLTKLLMIESNIAWERKKQRKENLKLVDVVHKLRTEHSTEAEQELPQLKKEEKLLGILYKDLQDSQRNIELLRNYVKKEIKFASKREEAYDQLSKLVAEIRELKSKGKRITKKTKEVKELFAEKEKIKKLFYHERKAVEAEKAKLPKVTEEVKEEEKIISLEEKKLKKNTKLEKKELKEEKEEEEFLEKEKLAA